VRTLVLGLGNPILTDDGVGVLVAEAVRSHLPEDTSIDISEVSVGGLSLMEAMVGYDRVILVDAYQSEYGKPGTIHKMSLADLDSVSPTQHSVSPHDANLTTALRTGQQMGLHLPDEITIFAIEVENVTEFGDRLTPSVAAAIPAVTKLILEEINPSQPQSTQ